MNATTKDIEHTESISVLLSVKVCAGRANFSERGSPVLPLPSTGRGNEGEGWSGRSPPSCAMIDDVPTPHPGPLPVEGSGSIVGRSLPFVWLRLRRPVYFVVALLKLSGRVREPDSGQSGSLRWPKRSPL